MNYFKPINDQMPGGLSVFNATFEDSGFTAAFNFIGWVIALLSGRFMPGLAKTSALIFISLNYNHENNKPAYLPARTNNPG
ncbi:hypothetical protein [Emticicia sp. 21SJ11W-3]|uniref:hypothetical protein n=1 Tax=Emticicia sp. 21SJ11W-3 TaxID=2916755 RepID=UPI0020A20C9A|nr:hypothetical protein [Emticicia sp. 21SJ11W-3]UTA69641.1 hypothetical protein MB380_07480 [Emticicia sp. 21SJ11W-3]